MSTSVLQLPCQVYCSRFSPNRAQQLVGFGGKDGAVYVYPFEDYSRAARLEGDASPLTALAFDPQQHRVVGGSDSGGVRLWDVTTEQSVRSFDAGHKSTVTGADYHRYTDFIATCSRDKSLRIWDTRKKTCLQSYKGASAPLCATQFSPNGRWAASGCAKGVIRLYDLVSGKQLNEFRAHEGAITSIHFHPEQYYMAVGSSDGSVSLWELEKFTKVFQSNPLDTPVDAVHLYGKKLLLAAYHVLRVYDFTMMSDNTAIAIESPWNIIGDLTYSSLSDEAWFVEFSSGAATMGRLSLGCGKDVISHPVTSMGTPSLKFSSVWKVEKTPGSAGNTILKPQQQQNQQVCADTAPTRSPEFLANSPVEDLLGSSASMLSVLRRRLTHIRVIRSLWARDSPQALEYLRRLCVDKSDCGVLTDFLMAMQHMRMKERINISTLPDLLDLLACALNSGHESSLLAAVKVFRSMTNKFRVKMDEARRFATSLRTVDAGVPEPMMQRYDELSAKFKSVAILVYNLHERKGPVGEEVREALHELPNFLQVE
ncbi:putative katanin [Trypanosoma cruzi]|uniref:Katanin, putative n=2 Tax=Trypanosoma cruzi TaxID=5693 RepID=Q4D7Q0_TRYCC|nr:katanin, putative [Trypanosoma cruzi]EAN88545.1 katanin, putative [Trypanosoma cruzi]PWV22112.1 putative katanin [Trypanosoma cruzi]RNC49727.1 putative katanin [Trypanosoma cruzi]|eukprot:XP_810396.1 katanin [Trypanosoma cruzi strain CL Brener]